MKAIRIHEFGPPEVMKLEDVPDPAPAPGQVRVRIHAIGVNPVETYIRSGIYGQPGFPLTPGTDAAGVVDAVGDGVTRIKPGDRVYTSGAITGAYAQLALCAGSQVHPLPPHISFEQGAAIGIPYATAYRALFQRGNAQPAETLLIHGASGGVGIAAVQIARAAGLTTIGTAGTDRGRDLVLQQGAHHVLDHHNPDYLKQILSLTDGRGVDLVLEMLANVNLGKDLSILATTGRIIIIGSRGPIEFLPRDIMAREADVRGMVLFNTPERDKNAIHAALVAGLENRTLRPVIGQTMPLSDAPRAHHEVMKPGAYGKIVLTP